MGPATWNYNETRSTLRYANRAKNIKNSPTVNEDPKDAKLKQVKAEIEELKRQLAARGGADAEQARCLLLFFVASQLHGHTMKRSHMVALTPCRRICASNVAAWLCGVVEVQHAPLHTNLLSLLLVDRDVVTVFSAGLVHQEAAHGCHRQQCIMIAHHTSNDHALHSLFPPTSKRFQFSPCTLI